MPVRIKCIVFDNCKGSVIFSLALSIAGKLDPNSLNYWGQQVSRGPFVVILIQESPHWDHLSNVWIPKRPRGPDKFQGDIPAILVQTTTSSIPCTLVYLLDSNVQGVCGILSSCIFIVLLPIGYFPAPKSFTRPVSPVLMLHKDSTNCAIKTLTASCAPKSVAFLISEFLSFSEVN